MAKHCVDSQITFDIKFPDYEGKFTEEPHEVEFVAVHYVERNRDQEEESLNKATSFGIDDMEKVSTGKYKIVWSTKGLKEGDYFISWKWKPKADGKFMYSYEKFYLASGLVPGISGKEAQRDKYDVLMNLYMPETYKNKIFDGDLTPHVIKNLNKAAGDGFMMLEDLANKTIDILDANTTHQAVLPLLANMFNLKLKSDDVTKWRRQIKRALPLFKKKGTYSGLEEALSQAGIQLKKLTILWQVLPIHTWTDVWLVEDEEVLSFPLTKKPLADNFELFIRPAGEANYIKVPNEFSDFHEEDGKRVLRWQGHKQPDKLKLFQGDILRLSYAHKKMSAAEQEIENYINRLPLADSRDETLQKYPLKNWNARLLEEDDAMFSVIVPERHPFQETLVYGRVRSTFLYSEKVYNMDTYNGSLRDSTNPADIDRQFLDNCGACRSSKFNVDLVIENMSSDRILEAREIIEEYSPFHATLHSMNISGIITEYILPPVERIRTDVEHVNTGQRDAIEIKENISYTIYKKNGTTERKKI